jgi:EAL domain-containing protein (putative c-di-GMP-specific phosphodiesterase class I)
VAEGCGLIGQIGRWVQETACRQAVEWQRLRPDSRPIYVSVNLSARQVANRSYAASVVETLNRSGLEPGQLRLEVTENALVDDAESAAATLDSLSRTGASLVLDDFGTGYSSLAYLNRFPFDALKVDRSFVHGLGVEQEHGAIVEAILGMARALSLDTIAEGVESEAQLAELRRLGCDYAQGHLFSRPLPAAAVTELIAEGSLELLGDAAR